MLLIIKYRIFNKYSISNLFLAQRFKCLKEIKNSGFCNVLYCYERKKWKFKVHMLLLGQFNILWIFFHSFLLMLISSYLSCTNCEIIMISVWFNIMKTWKQNPRSWKFSEIIVCTYLNICSEVCFERNK